MRSAYRRAEDVSCVQFSVLRRTIHDRAPIEMEMTTRSSRYGDDTLDRGRRRGIK